MKTPDISVVVCTYNRAEMLGGALESLACQETDGKFSYEILVIDDGSTDGTEDVVKEIVRKTNTVPVRYVHKQGGGLGDARNRGIAEARGKWIAFFDDDQLAKPNWLKELLALTSKTGAHCVGGTVRLCLSEQKLSQLSLITRSMLGETVGRKEPEKCVPKNYPGGGNVLIKSTVFDAVGQFDESMIRGGTDTEFFARVRMAGIEVWYTPRAVVHHLVPSYRLKDNYLSWRSLRCGDNFANRDCIEWGLAKTILVCIARIGQALLVNLPRLLLAYVLRDQAEVIGRKCLLWRCVGYVCQTLSLVAPKLFQQKRFFAPLEARREKTSFIKSRGDFPVR